MNQDFLEDFNKRSRNQRNSFFNFRVSPNSAFHCFWASYAVCFVLRTCDLVDNARDQWRLGDPNRRCCYPSREDISDFEVYLPVQLFRFSFLVCPVPKQRAWAAPEKLIKSEGDQQGFEATHISSDSSFHLKKSSVQTSDSAVYYCALSDTVREAAGGAEHKPKGTDGVRLWAALQSSVLEASSKYFQLWSSELRTLEFLDYPTERNLGRDSVKRNLSAFLHKCLFSAHSHSP